jgi:hypothetical protein
MHLDQRYIPFANATSNPGVLADACETVVPPERRLMSEVSASSHV